ncbi:MAG: NAD(P)H-binding protein [Bacteroidota bacterium]
MDYTIFSPDWFTNAGEADYAITQKGHRETGTDNSRKSMGAFISTMVGNPDLHSLLKGENLGISKPN